MTARSTALATAAALVLATAPRPAAEQQGGQFRAATDMVSVYTTVIDRETGRLVTDLTARDFEIRDDGQIRPVALFSNDTQPFTAIVMLDRSASMFDQFGLVRDGALEFVKAMRPADRARIGSFSDEIAFSPDEFTGDPDVLSRILQTDLPDMGPSPVWEAIDRSMSELLPLGGRRVVLVFSDGHDDPGFAQGLTNLKDLLRRVRINGIMVYAIGFAAEVIQVSKPSVAVPRSPGGFPGSVGVPRGRPPSAPQGPVQFARERQPPDPGLRELAEESGGGYFRMDDARHLRATFAQVAHELHQQYWLGFVPARLDGKVHEIEVRVRRRGLDVRARRTYVATPPGSR
jgi:Ca-activated chloride channel family protein